MPRATSPGVAAPSQNTPSAGETSVLLSPAPGNGRVPFDGSRLRRPRRRRGWVVRRSLVTADLIGLSAAFAVLQVVIGPGDSGDDRIPVVGEAFLFLLSLPLWVAAAQAMGLYSRDEERPEHTTVDDLTGVFQLVTVIVWVTFVSARLTQAEFAARFPFEETPDQQRAIDDVVADLGREKPMDRLICGDVGYGKTEVAMRAVWSVVLASSHRGAHTCARGRGAAG